MGARTQSGCVYQRGRVFWIKYYRDGRPYYENTKTDVKGDAKQLLQVRLGDIAKGIPVTPKVNQCRVDELLEDVRRDYERNDRKTTGRLRRASGCIRCRSSAAGVRRMSAPTTCCALSTSGARRAPQTGRSTASSRY